MTTEASRYHYHFDPNDTSTAARVCRWVGQGRQVLELGCAAGAMSNVLTHHYGCQVTGVEFDTAAAAQARAHCVQVLEASLDDPDWVQGLGTARFDTVLAADVLEHIRDPLACLRAVRALLPEQGGQVVVSVPTLAHSGVLASLLLNRFDYRDTGLLDRTHIHFFTLATLGEMLVQAGFAVTHTDTVDTGHWHPEFTQYWQELPPAVHTWLQNNPAGRAYQVIMRAEPHPNPPSFIDPSAQAQRAWLAQFPQAASTVSPDTLAASAARPMSTSVSETSVVGGASTGGVGVSESPSAPFVGIAASPAAASRGWWSRLFSRN